MPTYLHPGVYVEEISGGARPIEAVGTSTAAFIGVAERGPIDEPRFVTNFTEFTQIYGGYVKDTNLGASYLAYSVYQFFQNGGAACYVVRVEKDAKTAELALNTAQGAKTLTIWAISPGSWGNGLRIAIKRPGTTDPDGFNMYVFMKDELVEVYDDLSMVDSSHSYVERVTKRSLYISAQAEELPDNPTFVGLRELTGTLDLSKVYNIKLRIDQFGPYTIDCSSMAGTKTAVDPQEICNAINAAFLNDVHGTVADMYGKRIRIQSPTAEDGSKIIFTSPDDAGATDTDATEDIFGLVESSWEIKSDGLPANNLAIAYGRKNLSATAVASPNNIVFQDSTGLDLSAVDVYGATVWNVVKAINDATAATKPLNKIAPTNRSLAWSDGKYVVLKSDQDIRIKRRLTVNDDKTALANVFGPNFYAYVYTGSGISSAKIMGKIILATAFPDLTGKNYFRIKVDDLPTIVVDLTGAASFEDVADRINDTLLQETKKNIKVASVKNTASNTKKQLVLTSSSQGEASRLILMNSIEGEDAIPALMGGEADITTGTGTKEQEYFLIPADKPQRALLESKTPDLASDWTRNANVLNKSLRFTVDDRTIEIEGSETNPATNIKELFGVFSGKSVLNGRLITDAAANIDFVSFQTGADRYLRFSIPLKGTAPAQESDVHEETTPKDTVNAYRGLFGDVAVFQSSAQEYTIPNYEYEFGVPDNNPENTVIMAGDEMDFSQSLTLAGGSQDRSNGNKLGDLVLGADPDTISGVNLLDKLTDISILVIPGWESMDEDLAKRFVNGGIAYCDKQRPVQARPLRDLFFVTNTPKERTDPTAAKDFAQTSVDKSTGAGYSALYYPWIEVSDPIGTASPTIPIPPAGSIAGLYANIDGRRGVWKAPAGTEAGVAGVVKLADQVNDIKQDLLNPFGVNVIRRMPGAGIVSWGARTLYTNPEWKYVPVRRTAIMIEVSIYEGIQWAVFEPNDEPLWSSLRLSIGAFMMNLFRSGAFQGTKPEEAFFVKCDRETTTQIDIDLGKVNVLVGFAPLKPAEFVIVKISQMAGQKQ